MEHPLIDIETTVTIDDLTKTIDDLTKKLSWAQRHNHHLAVQVQMALESYRSRYKQLQDEMYKKSQQSGDNIHFDKISIS